MNNIPTDQINQLKSLIDGSQSIVIATGGNPTIDSLGASLSLYLALSSKGKQVMVICPEPARVEFNNLVGIDKVTNNLNSAGGQGKNLTISFPYQEGSIEKVSYNIENDAFNLVIEPRQGYQQITPELIRYSNSGGGTADVIITIGTPSLSDLQEIYQNNQGLFSEKPVINIDSHNQNSRYGKINIIDNSSSSTSELMSSLFSQLGLPMDGDIANNLYAGIVEGSQNFTSPATSVTTFETAALCLRSGAKKSSNPVAGSAAYFSTPPVPYSPQPKPQNYPKFTPKPSYQRPPTMVKNQPQRSFTPQQGYQSQPKIQQAPNQFQKQSINETPPDWLKPKIFKGSTLL